MRYILLVVAVAASTAIYAQPNPILVSPEWLQEHKQDKNLVILQTNFLRLDFETEHIPGAHFLWPDWLGAHSPEGNFNAPDLASARKTLQALGIHQNTQVVLAYTRTDLTVTARMFLTLEHLGLYGKVSLLNGGLEEWKRAGLPVEMGASPVVVKGNFEPRYQQLLVDKNYVQKALAGADKLVVDARLKRFYDGDVTGNPRDGHITGALNLPYPDLIDSTTKFKPVVQLTNYFNAVNKDKQKEMIGYCFIGQTASVVYLAGRILGYPMKIYDGSLQEWSRLPELPMEKTRQ
ncbi:sulfurtransferase [Sediminibacterium goheungense]|uniref:Thiosulfate/3-mercaptopyruvate sulfurtransferase n=1 Tax=Sediminibacterium goheungense TaxID=1086393 RepID=A0A4R6J1B9_9BACT|nr:rhodanese-like domain-containing protein [Sediminibacterium goheungense]TDO28046.1 thiosulfate/3-mercaptopyruvate sulfurtransferase [Sediminibacterium goheungense]